MINARPAPFNTTAQASRVNGATNSWPAGHSVTDPVNDTAPGPVDVSSGPWADANGVAEASTEASVPGSVGSPAGRSCS